jgi:malonate decarboxylase gamma subunit
MTMDWQSLTEQLFGPAHQVRCDDDFLSGQATVGGQDVTVVGTTHHAPIGVRMAMAQAAAVLDTVTHHPGRAIVLLVDTEGQQLRRRDELLGINRAMAHLGCCIDLARRQGHRVVALVYDQALSGGFITSGLMADACYALPDAQIRVMRIPAMARVTKIAAERLEAMSVDNPVFAPGVSNYVAMGGVQATWEGDLAGALREALANDVVTDQRAVIGQARGGRRLAAEVAQRVLDAV